MPRSSLNMGERLRDPKARLTRKGKDIQQDGMGLRKRSKIRIKREWPRCNSWELHITTPAGSNDFIKDRIIEHSESGRSC